MLRLISATPSPYARKVRIALAEKGIPFELVTEVPWNNGTSLPLHNPLEKLPVLLLPDGGSVYESSHILEWLELKHPEPPLLPGYADGVLEAKRCLVIGDGICDALLLLFFERKRPEAHRSVPWTARQTRKVEGGFADMARTVGNRAFILENRLTLADIGFGAVLGYAAVRFPELDWKRRWPSLVDYYERLSERPSFRDTIPYPQQITDAVV